jgi:hypothetical protein
MKNKLHVLSLFVLIVSGVSQASVLTFDETPALGTWTGGTLVDGFSLPALTGLSGQATSYSDWGQTAYSGSNALLNFNSRSGTIVRDSAFNFDGAWFISNMYGDNSSTTFSLYGLDQSGNTLFSDTQTVTNNWTLLEYDWDNIWGLSFNPQSPDSQNMAMDNLTYNLDPQVVPEPSIIALISLGIFGLGLSRRKMKK